VTLEEIGTVDKLPVDVVDDQRLRDTIHRQSLCVLAFLATVHGTSASLRRWRTHRIVKLRTGSHLLLHFQIFGQPVEPVAGTGIHFACVMVDNEMTDVVAVGVKHSGTEFLKAKLTVNNDQQDRKCRPADKQ
jgi:hypothetical protein